MASRLSGRRQGVEVVCSDRRRHRHSWAGRMFSVVWQRQWARLVGPFILHWQRYATGARSTRDKRSFSTGQQAPRHARIELLRVGGTCV
jgi:hypothetical protein